MISTFISDFKKYKTEFFIVCVAFLGTMCALWDVGSWKFFVVGDEFIFWSLAKNIVEMKFLVNPLSLNGGYNENPMLGSYIQAVFLFLFGMNYIVWKSSGVVLLFPSTILLYKFVRRIWGRNPAVISAVLLAFSKYLSNFFKGGWPNSICFLGFILCLFYMAELMRSPTNKNAVKLGIILGLSFLIYVGPLFLFLLAPFYFIFFKRAGRKALKFFAISMTIFLVIVGMSLLTSHTKEWFEAVMNKTLHREFKSNAQILVNIGRNFLLFFKNFDYFYNHFVAGPYLDIVSRWAAFVGILVCAFSFWKKEGLLLFLWMILCVGIGLTSPYIYSPSSRGIFFIPYGVVFAGLGFEFLRKRLNKFRLGYIVPILVVAAIALNVYEAKIGVFQKTGYNRTALVTKELLNLDQEVILLYSQEYKFDIGLLKFVMELQNIPPSRLSVTQNIDEACNSSNGKIVIFQDDPAFHQFKLADSCREINQTKRIFPINGYYP